MARDYSATYATKAGSRSASSNSDSNVLGRGIRVRGRLNGASDLRIDGEVEGDVSVGGSLELGEGATINGNVAAKSVVIDGALTGDVQAEGTVTIRANARVSGNMNGAEISLEEGAAFTGRIEADFELPDGLAAGVGPRGVGAEGRRNARGR
ncbi:MAG: polymer-forming cytoskeletal protein [Polyangiaceae bacterium]|nr:polymer-forming cytoskeletal protein [Polyangiaceae bacterium]